MVQRILKAVFWACEVLQTAGAGPGDTLAFFIHWSAAGKPQASVPCIRVAAANGFALRGTFKPGPSHGCIIQYESTISLMLKSKGLTKSHYLILHSSQAFFHLSTNINCCKFSGLRFLKNCG